MDPPLTTTSYAILGLLATKSWTTYELAQQMQRALGQFWPRAESKIYEEPKKLVAHGLTRASTELVGKRPRTRYTITAKGRRAMAAWVPTPGEGPVLEFEQLIKVFFAEHGTKDDLLATIAGVQQWIDNRYIASRDIPKGYLEGRGPFPERLPWILLAGQFLTEFMLAVDRWAGWAAELVATWPDDLSAAEPDWKTLEAMTAETEDHAARAAARIAASQSSQPTRARCSTREPRMHTAGASPRSKTTSRKRAPSGTLNGRRRPMPNATSSFESSRARLAWVVAIDEPHPRPSVLESA